MYKTFSLIVLLMLASTVYGVEPYEPVYRDPLLESWHWRTFPELKGLGARCMAEDHEGNFWFGITDGVVRYDGLNWVTYKPEDGLMGKPVNALVVGQDGSVYAGTSKSISRFINGSWQTIFPTSEDVAAGSEQVMPWVISDLIEASDGSLWAGTELGALRLKASKATLYTTPAHVTGLRILAPNVELVVLPERLTPIRPREDRFGIVGSINTYVPFLDHEFAPWGITIAPEGSDLKAGDLVIEEKRLASELALTVRRQGRSDPFKVTLKPSPEEPFFNYFSVRDVFEDQTGAIWFSLYLGEIISCGRLSDAKNARVNSWRIYSKKDGLEIGVDTRVYQTRDATIWTVSNDWAGVNRFDGESWTTFSFRYSLNTSILETKDGTLWIGASNGTLYVNPHYATDATWIAHEPPAIPTPNARIIALTEASDGALWMLGNQREVGRLDLQSTGSKTFLGIAFVTEHLRGTRWFLSEDGSIVSAKSDPEGTIWTRWTTDDGLMDLPHIITTSRTGELWAAGMHKDTFATARFDAGSEGTAPGWTLTTHPEFANNKRFTTVYAPKSGGVMFGASEVKPGQTGGILYRRGVDGSDGRSHTTYLTPPDVPAIIIMGMGETSDGALWIGYTNGVYRFDGKTGQRIAPTTKLGSFVDSVH